MTNSRKATDDLIAEIVSESPELEIEEGARRRSRAGARRRKVAHDRTDPEFTAKLRPWFDWLYKVYFRCEMTGWENLPEKDPVLFVGNHNGLLTFEILMMFHAWREKFGNTRRALGLAHNVAMNFPAFSWIVPKLGAIPASPKVALETLAAGYSLMVFPGGEKESFRPWSERKMLDFFGRKGWIRIARDSGVPLCPVVSVGGHESYVILSRGDRIAEQSGLKDRLRVHGFPITPSSLFLMGCLSTGVLTFFPLLLVPAALVATLTPLPAKMTFRILPPFDVRAMWDSAMTDDENLERIYAVITNEMQRVLDEEYSKRRLPIVG